MINFKTLAHDKDNVAANLLKRGYILEHEQILGKQKQLNELKHEIEKINAKINRQEHTPEEKEQLKQFKKDLVTVENEYEDIIHLVPNIIHDTVPPGKGAEDNPVVKVANIEHLDTGDYIKKGKPLGLDIEAGVELAGARFTVLRGEVAKLHRKLINTALDFYTDQGYEEIYVPNLVKKEIVFGTAQYPKFKEEIFTTHMNEDLFLLPTGEVPLTNLVRDRVLKENEVETKMMTHTPCFRKEVGAAGKDTKGIVRQHQFEKVELVRTCLPENGLKNLEEMMEDVEKFIKTLNLQYRIIELCAGDLGFAGHKAYDFELWFAHDKRWREIASITWCHDFQARRMNARFKRNGKPELIHTLNGTGLAAGRVMAAILENNCVDGKIIF
jgi:seryl-tRNA synthetase